MPKRLSPRISLGLLRGFEAAARHLSFTKAAKELFLTQSAISREIKTLESQLKRTLFVRMNRGLVLTEAGQALYGVVGEALGLIGEEVERLASSSNARTLTVTCSVAFAALWLVPRLQRFTASRPDVDIRIAATDRVIGELDREHVDLAIRHFRQESAPRGAVQLAHEEVLPVCAPSLMRDRQRPLRRPEDLSRHVLLHFETHERGWPLLIWARWLKALGVPDLTPAGALRFSHYDQMIDAAIAGSGIALGRRVLVARHLLGGELVAPLDGTATAFGVYSVVFAAGASGRPDTGAFVDWMGEEMRRDQIALSADSPQAATPSGCTSAPRSIR